MKSLLCVIAVLLSLPALAADDRSHAFIRDAIEGHLFDAKAGEIAATRGSSETVRQYGAMLSKEHASAARKATGAAKSAGVTPPQAPNPEQQGLLTAMTKLEGDKFDDRFIKAMIDDHLRDVARYETQAKGSDPIAIYAADTLPSIRDQLKAAQGLENERRTR